MREGEVATFCFERRRNSAAVPQTITWKKEGDTHWNSNWTECKRTNNKPRAAGCWRKLEEREYEEKKVKEAIKLTSLTCERRPH